MYPLGRSGISQPSLANCLNSVLTVCDAALSVEDHDAMSLVRGIRKGIVIEDRYFQNVAQPFKKTINIKHSLYHIIGMLFGPS